MRENTPPHQQVYNLEEEIQEADDGELIYFDDDPMPDEESDEMEDILDYDDYEKNDGDEIEARVAERDDAILTFRKHTAPVFCCSLHPSKDLAATGGEDDCSYVWNTKTGDVVHEIRSHKDTVIAACFSHDGNYLATGDMAGEIQVIKVQDNFKKVWEFSMGDMSWLKWHTVSNVLLAGSETGEIYVWRIPSGDCKLMAGNGHKCETAELTADGKKLFAGYGDGSSKLWDIKNCATLVEVSPDSPMGHKECVSSVSTDPEKSLYISGGEDGKILLISNSGPVGVLEPAAGPIESVAFCPDPELKIAASGTLHGQIAIWDIAKQSIRTVCEHTEIDDGITTLKWISGATLICGTIQGNIFAFDGRSGNRKFDLQGHVAEVYDMCFDRRENILLTASEDSTAKIFKIEL